MEGSTIIHDEENPLKPVNDLRSLLKSFTRIHVWHDREHLQDWMNSFYFITNKSKDKYDKVLKFIELFINSSKRVKYRNVIHKKGHEYNNS